jgi:hypothetical protein
MEYTKAVARAVYLKHIDYNDSHISKLIKDPTQPRLSSVAWKYFSNTATTKDYENIKISWLKKTFVVSLGGVLFTLARTISDLFIQTIKLLWFWSPLSFGDRSKQLAFCLGRDLGELGSYLALPFTNKGFHWAEHNRFQRELLLQQEKKECNLQMQLTTPSKKISAHLLKQILENNDQKAFDDFVNLYRNPQKGLKLQFVIESLGREIRNKSDLLKNLSFLLTPSFDVDYWTQDHTFSNLNLFLDQYIQPNAVALENIYAALIDKEKYGEAFSLTNPSGTKRSKNVSTALYYKLFTKIKDKHQGDIENTKKALIEGTTKLTDHGKDRLLTSLCTKLREKKVDNPFVFPLVEEMTVAGKKNFMVGDSFELTKSKIELLENTTYVEKMSPAVTAFCNLHVYLCQENRNEAYSRLIFTYIKTNQVEKAIEIFTSKTLAYGGIILNANQKKLILQRVMEIATADVSLSFQLNEDQVKFEHAPSILKLIEGVDMEEEKVIYNHLVKETFKQKPSALIPFMKEDDHVLKNLFEYSFSEGYPTTLAFDCLIEIYPKDKEYFDDNLERLTSELIKLQKKDYETLFVNIENDDRVKQIINSCIQSCFKYLWDKRNELFIEKTIFLINLLDDSYHRKQIPQIILNHIEEQMNSTSLEVSMNNPTANLFNLYIEVCKKLPETESDDYHNQLIEILIDDQNYYTRTMHSARIKIDLEILFHYLSNKDKSIEKIKEECERLKIDVNAPEGLLASLQLFIPIENPTN